MTLKKIDLIQSTRTCLMLDDDVDRIVRKYQATLIQQKSSSCSYSQAVNQVLRISLRKKI